jgi:hypothetical protein
MVALVQRVRKLEKKVADRSKVARLDDRVVYQPSAEDLAEALTILVECGAVRVVPAKELSKWSGLLTYSACGGHSPLQLSTVNRAISNRSNQGQRAQSFR